MTEGFFGLICKAFWFMHMLTKEGELVIIELNMMNSVDLILGLLIWFFVNWITNFRKPQYRFSDRYCDLLSWNTENLRKIVC